jgi:hypothetical protein
MPLLVALITVNIVLGALIWSEATAQRRMSERLSAKDPALDIEVGPNLGPVAASPFNSVLHATLKWGLLAQGAG